MEYEPRTFSRCHRGNRRRDRFSCFGAFRPGRHFYHRLLSSPPLESRRICIFRGEKKRALVSDFYTGTRGVLCEHVPLERGKKVTSFRRVRGEEKRKRATFIESSGLFFSDSFRDDGVSLVSIIYCEGRMFLGRKISDMSGGFFQSWRK